MKTSLDFLGLSQFSEISQTDVAALQGIGLDNKDQIYSSIQDRIRKHLPIFAEALGKLHCVEKSQRYWRIALGHWFARLIHVAHFRWQVIGALFPLKGTSANDMRLIEIFSPCLSIASTHQFNSVLVDQVWNERLTDLSIALCTGRSVISTKYVPVVTDGEQETSNVCAKVTKKLTHMGWSLYSRNRTIIYKSYLTRKTNFLLHIFLGILPKAIRMPELKDKETDVAIRCALYRAWSGQFSDDLDRLIAVLAVCVLPRSFLEAYRENVEQIKSAVCGRGDVVFTSNGFDCDDIFQLFSAESAEGGAAYLVGQHGNNYNSSRHFYSDSELQLTADGFLSWGVKVSPSNGIPLFNFKYPDVRLRYSVKGPLLILLHRPPTPHFAWDRNKEFESYLTDIEYILNELARMEVDTIVRFHRSFEFYGGNKYELMERYPSFEWDDGEGSLAHLIKRSCLIVHTYHSTGILETLNQGVPTVAFWRCGWELDDGAESDYNKLQSADILFRDPNKLLQRLSRFVAGDVFWLESTARKAVIKEFCERYSRSSNSPVRTLARVFNIMRRT